MTTQELTNEIKNLASELNISFVEACQAMQAAAAQKNDEKMIMTIHKIKMQSVNL